MLRAHERCGDLVLFLVKCQSYETILDAQKKCSDVSSDGPLDT